jgi:hypothetical protein
MNVELKNWNSEEYTKHDMMRDLIKNAPESYKNSVARSTIKGHVISESAFKIYQRNQHKYSIALQLLADVDVAINGNGGRSVVYFDEFIEDVLKMEEQRVLRMKEEQND